ncbi:MAG: excinuclease ABC subunit UvrC [Caldilineaceae bacterium]
MNTQLPPRVKEKLKNLPEKPGCYLMRNADETVIYVGKAVVLKNRVRSYFNKSAQRHPKTAALVADIADITWWVTETELEALILENELIKRYRPRYNVRMKDDRQYPYIKVNWQDDFPKIEVVRKMSKDGARYFGPYNSSTACYQTLDALRRIFPYLDCDREITGDDARPCLYYHIKMCGGPCIGRQSKAEYRATVKQLMDFLTGSTDEVLGQLEAQMNRAAENLQFELAALYRDRFKAAQKIAEQQKIISASMEDADYVAVALDAQTADAAVQVYKVRGGRLIGRENFLLEGTDVPEADVNQQGLVIGSFVQQFYEESAFVPRLILVQAMPDDWAVLEEWLGTKRGSGVELRVPSTPTGCQTQAHADAGQQRSRSICVQKAEGRGHHRQTQALTELQEALQLPAPPTRIERATSASL